MLRLEIVHPMVVHFPVVFVLTLAVFDTVAAFVAGDLGGRSAAASISAGLAVLAGISAIAAYYFGDAAYDIAISKGVAPELLNAHHYLGGVTTILLTVFAVFRAWGWWRRAPITGVRAVTVVSIEIALALLIIITAYFGGELVYRHGVNVMQTHTAP